MPPPYPKSMKIHPTRWPHGGKEATQMENVLQQWILSVRPALVDCSERGEGVWAARSEGCEGAEADSPRTTRRGRGLDRGKRARRRARADRASAAVQDTSRA